MGVAFRVVRKLATSRPAALAAGAAIMYYADPDRGRSRRVQTVAETKGSVRRAARRTVTDTERQLHYTEGRLKGAAVRARGGGRFHPESEVDLREHIRQVVRSLPLRTSDVNVDVAKGTAYLRGQIQSEADGVRIKAAVIEIDGVARIEDYLHLPGTPAPNKAAVLHISEP